MKIKPFVPKSHPKMPDGWGITVEYLDGTKDQLEGTHRFIDVLGGKFLEIFTLEDECCLISAESIKRLTLDKRFSEALEYNREVERKRIEAEAALKQTTATQKK